jgi:hypothetical protein
MTAGIVVMVALFMAAGCGSERELASPQTASPSSGQSPMGAHSAAELTNAATTIVAFLQGSAGFEQFELADKVSLHLSPEGGGTRRELSREMLRDRFNWKVRSEAFDHIYSFVPPQAEWELTTRVGRHLNCGYDYALATRVERLSASPHVGTTLYPRSGDSCLQSWNLTFVFDPEIRPPTLVAVVYDQWEW